MSESLNVIALISGGKDSLFSILHCLENGHKVVALANLYPKQSEGREVEEGSSGDQTDSEGEDLNSFMYQTVGHSVIPLYSECLGIPLYRREISGSAVQTGRYYDAGHLDSSADETEDLVPLLREVRRTHPEANAISSGAILSTYQRTRLESIAVRLGLTPLAYLWQYPALPPPAGRGESVTGLLDDMAAADCDARIIKIASGGIKESLLWSNVADPKTQLRLVNGLQPFFPDHEFWLRGAVVGEGGEYETLAINGPKRLWKRRIEIPEEQMSAFTGQGGVSYLRLANPRTVENEPDTLANATSLRIPSTFDLQFQAVLAELQSQQTLNGGREVNKLDRTSTDTVRPRQETTVDLRQMQCLRSGELAVSNLTSQASAGTAAMQMQHICHDLKSSLDSISSSVGLSTSLTPSNIVFTILLLKDMSDFGAVNSIYASLFRTGEPNPPARVTVACSLPAGVEVSLSGILHLGPRDARRGLHVQSRSYWAPANIGPYSQAICVPLDMKQDQGVNVHDAELVEMAHMAGQIPLAPPTMQLSGAGFVEQAVLSLQHLWRVGQERGVDIWPWGIAFLESTDTASVRAELSCRVWRQAHLAGARLQEVSDATEDDEGDEGPDAWDLQYNRAMTFDTPATLGLNRHLHPLPNSAVLKAPSNTASLIPPFIAAEVVSLPRSAPVEWWSMGITNLPKRPASRPRVSVIQRRHPWGSIHGITFSPSSEAATEGYIHLVTAFVRRETISASSVDFVSRIGGDLLALLLSNQDPSKTEAPSAEVVHCTAFVSTEGVEQWSRLSEHRLFENLVLVPCNAVYGWPDSAVDDILSPDSTGLSSSTAPGLRDSDDGAGSSPTQRLAVAITMRING
jgi:diphthine-ammonia ligase